MGTCSWLESSESSSASGLFLQVSTRWEDLPWEGAASPPQEEDPDWQQEQIFLSLRKAKGPEKESSLELVGFYWPPGAFPVGQVHADMSPHGSLGRSSTADSHPWWKEGTSWAGQSCSWGVSSNSTFNMCLQPCSLWEAFAQG